MRAKLNGRPSILAILSCCAFLIDPYEQNGITLSAPPEVHVSESLLLAPIIYPKDFEQYLVEYKRTKTMAVNSANDALSIAIPELRRSQRIEKAHPLIHTATLLGELHSQESLPLLLQVMPVRDSSYSPASNEKRLDWNSFPFAVAVSEIGIPAVRPLLEHIITTPVGTTDFHVSCVTLEKILGSELAELSIRQYAREFSERGQHGWKIAAIELTEVGHREWYAGMAKDFRIE